MDAERNGDIESPPSFLQPAPAPLPGNVVVEIDTLVSKKIVSFCKWTLFAVFVASLFFPIAITSKPVDNPLAIAVLFAGWLGIFIGNISWYWIIPTILYFRNISNGKFQTLKLLTKVIYFLIPLIGLIQSFFVFGVGKNTPGNAGGGSPSIIVSHATAFYLYVSMVSFVLLLMAVTNISSNKKRNGTVFKILNTIFLLVSLGVVLLSLLKN